MWILPQVPEQKLDISRAILIASRTNTAIPHGISLSQYEQNQALVHKAFASQSASGASVLDLTEFCFRDGNSMIGQLDGKYYTDNNHLSLIGSRVLIKPAIEPVFEQMMRDSNTAGSLNDLQSN